MGTSSKLLAKQLQELANRQHGCFTAAQAIAIGYADSVHLYHVKAERWIRVFRGVYRLANLPETPETRCMAALFWTRDKNGQIQGVLAPETIKMLKNMALSSAKPIKILVPKHFRRSASVPDGISLIPTDFDSITTSNYDGMPAVKEESPGPRPDLKPTDFRNICDYYDQIDYQNSLWRTKP